MNADSAETESVLSMIVVAYTLDNGVAVRTRFGNGSMRVERYPSVADYWTVRLQLPGAPRLENRA